ncbi:alanyl-tRNA editing protein [Kushneria konosiri]|uniref:Synthetase n=1 Tax=Kushneria konosiri TaxID=698828 RepID=A0A2Z2HB05_9GAMM|nr:alanyl-tRNA editing protein [Kushneria konosiri]ARS54454.1 synthetase [Kushneria konosiri]
MRTTDKLYYLDQYLYRAEARIARLHAEAIELDRTVAFPEGGGQEGDIGTIETPVGTFRFIWTKRLYGTPLSIEGFTGVKSGGIILHLVHPDDIDRLGALEVDMPVSITIDVERRARLTLSHTASHFLYAAALSHQPDLKRLTIGCHIKEEAARFDFLIETPFQPDDVNAIQSEANRLMADNLPIITDHLSEHYDARFWQYGDIYIPCGGTHLETPEAVGPLQVRRKNIGKGKERLLCSFDQARIKTDEYHVDAERHLEAIS